MGDKTNDDLWKLLGQMDAKLDRVISDSGAQDKRITVLERARSLQKGIVLTVATTASAVGAIITIIVEAVRH